MKNGEIVKDFEYGLSENCSVQFLPLNVGNLKRFLAHLLVLDTQCFGSEHAWGVENFRCDLPRKADLSFVGLVDRDMVGYVIASAYSFADQETGHLHRIGVSSLHRGKGIGREMVMHLAVLCERYGLKQLTLEIGPLFPADAFYANLGFQKMPGERLAAYLEAKGRLNQLEGYQSGSGQVFFMDVAPTMGEEWESSSPLEGFSL